MFRQISYLLFFFFTGFFFGFALGIPQPHPHPAILITSLFNKIKESTYPYEKSQL
jgi:hypothetical protein